MFLLSAISVFIALTASTDASPVPFKREDATPALQSREPELSSILPRASDDSTKVNAFGGGSFGGGGFGGGFANGGFGSGGFGRGNGFGNVGLSLGVKRDELTLEHLASELDESTVAGGLGGGIGSGLGGGVRLGGSSSGGGSFGAAGSISLDIKRDDASPVLQNRELSESTRLARLDGPLESNHEASFAAAGTGAGIGLVFDRDDHEPAFFDLANIEEGIASADAFGVGELDGSLSDGIGLKREAGGVPTHQARELLLGVGGDINLGTTQPWRFDRVYMHD